MNNSLAEVHPELISEWSEKNLPLTPEDITFGSNKKVWWKGACGHEWQTSVKARSNGEKCPISVPDFIEQQEMDDYYNRRAEEKMRLFVTAMASLTEKQHKYLVMRYVDGISARDIAKADQCGVVVVSLYSIRE